MTRTLWPTYSITLDRIVGFEELGNSDGFTTEVLERRLGKSGNRADSGRLHTIINVFIS